MKADEEATRHRRLVDQLFDAALDLPPGERAALLDERCPTSLRADETIVLTALRPEPERRYATAKAMVDDVQAFLGDLPIEARGDSLAYRARNFYRRALDIRYRAGDHGRIEESRDAYVDFLREQDRLAEADEVLARYAVEYLLIALDDFVQPGSGLGLQ